MDKLTEAKLAVLPRRAKRIYRATGGRIAHCVSPGQAYREGHVSEPLPDEPQSWTKAARTLVHEWGFRCLKVDWGQGTARSQVSEKDVYWVDYNVPQSGEIESNVDKSSEGNYRV